MQLVAERRAGLGFDRLLLPVAVAIFAALVVTNIIGHAEDPLGRLARSGYDEIMRLVSVREWLGGAGWFDTTIDRVLPPEGLSLHWSRYVDAGIGGLILLLSLGLPPETAEAWAIVIWPLLLFAGFAWLSVRLALRLFGTVGAAFPLLACAFWHTLSDLRFAPLQLDHHGLQVLLMLGVVAAAVLPRQSFRSGLWAGGCAALSLAVGLEMLVGLALAGLIVMGRAVAAPDRFAAALAGFGLALAGGAVVLFVGQTPRVEWALARCDELAAPILALVTASAAAAAIFAGLAPRIARLPVRAGVAAGLGAVALAVSLPALGPCFAGPYGNLPEDIQRAIAQGISEARPAFAYFSLSTELARDTLFGHLTPAYAATLMATGFCAWRLFRSPAGAGPADRAAALLLVFAWAGVLGAFVQYRMLVIAEPVIPLLAGYVAACLIAGWQANRDRAGPGLAMIAGLCVMLLPGQINEAVEDIFEARAETRAAPGGAAAAVAAAHPELNHCRDPEILTTLDSLPPANLMAMGNLGRPALILTGHSISISPYHRSERLMRNLMLHQERDPEVLRAAMAASRAEYLVMCRNALYGGGDAYVSDLANGAVPLPGWLVPVEVPGLHPDLLVLRFDPA